MDEVSLENRRAETITALVLKYFNSYGLHKEYLKKKSDGASVMVGEKSKVDKLL